MSDGEPQLYTSREVDLFIVNLREQFKLWDVKLDNIHSQVKTINGNVKSNTNDVKCLKTWRDRMVGALAVIAAVVFPLFAYVVKLWFG